MVSLGIGGSDLFGRKVVNASHPLTASFATQFMATLATLIGVIVVSSEFAIDDFARGAVSGLGFGAGLACYYLGIVRSSATVVSPTSATITAVISFGYAVLRGQEVALIGFIGAGVAFLGLAIIGFMGADLKANLAGFPWAICSGIGYGTGIAFLIDVSDESGMWPAVSGRFVSALAIFAAVAVMKLPKLPPRPVRKTVVLAGITAASTSCFSLLGLAANPAHSVVTSSLFPAFSVLIGFTLYGDSVNRRQLGGLLLVLAGVIAVVRG